MYSTCSALQAGGLLRQPIPGATASDVIPFVAWLKQEGAAVAAGAPVVKRQRVGEAGQAVVTATAGDLCLVVARSSLNVVFLDARTLAMLSKLPLTVAWYLVLRGVMSTSDPYGLMLPVLLGLAVLDK